MEMATNLFGDDAHEHVLFDAFSAERNASISLGEQRVIGADTHVLTRAIYGTALAHEDVARDDLLATELLQTKSFGF
jgi:hypothetical protein